MKDNFHYLFTSIKIKLIIVVLKAYVNKVKLAMLRNASLIFKLYPVHNTFAIVDKKFIYINLMPAQKLHVRVSETFKMKNTSTVPMGPLKPLFFYVGLVAVFLWCNSCNFYNVILLFYECLYIC